MKLEDRLVLTEVDMTAGNAARIGALAVSELGSERPPTSLLHERIVPLCAFAYAALYLLWAAGKAGLL